MLLNENMSTGLISLCDFAEIIPQPENVIPRAAVTCPALPNNTSQRCEVKASAKSHSKQHLREADAYEPYARSGRIHSLEKRPEWNTQRPSKAFVPASERYPEALQRHRQESRKQRQQQLMTLLERSTPQPLHNHKPQTQTLRTAPPAQGQRVCRFSLVVKNSDMSSTKRLKPCDC